MYCLIGYCTSFMQTLSHSMRMHIIRSSTFWRGMTRMPSRGMLNLQQVQVIAHVIFLSSDRSIPTPGSSTDPSLAGVPLMPANRHFDIR